MMKRLLLLFFAALALSGCYAFHTAADKVKEVEIGMTEKQVIGIMGKDYAVDSAWDNTRVISYAVFNTDWIYKFYFVNNRLESFERIHIPKFPIPKE